MDEQQQIEEQLWAYIDGLGSDAERQTVAAQLQTDAQWQQIYAGLMQFEKNLQQTLRPTETNSKFTEYVMDRVAAEHPPTLEPVTRNEVPIVMKGIAAFFLVCIGGGLLYTLYHIKWGNMVLLPSSRTTQILAGLPGSTLMNAVLCSAGAIVMLLYAEMWLRHKRTTAV